MNFMIKKLNHSDSKSIEILAKNEFYHLLQIQKYYKFKLSAIDMPLEKLILFFADDKDFLKKKPKMIRPKMNESLIHTTTNYYFLYNFIMRILYKKLPKSLISHKFFQFMDVFYREREKYMGYQIKRWVIYYSKLHLQSNINHKNLLVTVGNSHFTSIYKELTN